MPWLIAFSLMSILVSIIIFAFAWKDRTEKEQLKPIACFLILVSLSILASLVWSWIIWTNTDLRGDNILFLSRPVHKILSFIYYLVFTFGISLVALIIWWILKKIIKNGLIAAMIVPALFLYSFGPEGFVVLITTCITSWVLTDLVRVHGYEELIKD